MANGSWMSMRLLQDTGSSSEEGFLRQAVCCPVCRAGESMVALGIVEVDQGEHQVSVQGHDTSVVDKVPRAAVPTPIVDLHFTCFGGHTFTLRFLPVATGRVLMTAYLEKPDRPV